MATFKSGSGGHVTVFVPWQTAPIEVGLDGYTTDDKREIEALEQVPELTSSGSGGATAKAVEAEQPAAEIPTQEEPQPEQDEGPGQAAPEEPESRQRSKSGRKSR